MTIIYEFLIAEEMDGKLGSIDLTNKTAENILLLSTFRSGSTFLGSLINQYPGMFYSYEPGIYFDRGKVSSFSNFVLGYPKVFGVVYCF